MKNILIITHDLYPDFDGGVQKYNDILINIFYKDFNIDVLLIENIDRIDSFQEFYKGKVSIIKCHKKLKLTKSKNVLYIKINRYFNWIKIRKWINSNLDFNKYDYIIDQTQLNIKKLRTRNNVYWIPHCNVDILLNKINNNSLKWKIINLVLNFMDSITKIKRNLFYYQNIICFSPYDIEDFKSKSSNNKVNYYFIANPINTSNCENVFNFNNKIVSYSRFDDFQKNLKLLNEISRNLNSRIDVYGSGKDSFLLKDCNIFNEFKNIEIKEILSKYSVFIMVSNYEGFPFSLVEALSYGIPIIVRDTFPSAKFLVNGNNGILLDKNLNSFEISQIIESLLNNKQQLIEFSNNAFEFAQKNLSIDIFTYKWKKLIF